MPKQKWRRLSIIIPVFNEAAQIQASLRAVVTAPAAGLEKEIIIVDDGSTDDSWQEIQKFLQRRAKLEQEQSGSQIWRGQGIRWLVRRWQKNQGKGAAVRWGIGQSQGDIVLIQDADQEYDPGDYPDLLAPILAGRADVVYGSRFRGRQPHRVLYFSHYLGNKLITWWSNLWTGFNLTDVEVGYKVFRGSLIRRLGRQLRNRRFGWEIEITARLARVPNLRLYEVGISYWGRTYGEGKKISWRDGWRALWQAVYYRWC